MYHALTVVSECYRSDRSVVTYVSCAIVSIVQTFALTLYVCKTRAAS